MTVYRTVQISDDQIPRFEKMMEENRFEIILTEAPEIPLEVQKEICINFWREKTYKV